MLSLLAGSADQIRGQEWSAAAVKVTPVLRWNELVELLGPEILARRITELLDAVQNDDMEITQKEQSALVLGASYMTGNYPQRGHSRAGRPASRNRYDRACRNVHRGRRR